MLDDRRPGFERTESMQQLARARGLAGLFWDQIRKLGIRRHGYFERSKQTVRRGIIRATKRTHEHTWHNSSASWYCAAHTLSRNKRCCPARLLVSVALQQLKRSTHLRTSWLARSSEEEVGGRVLASSRRVSASVRLLFKTSIGVASLGIISWACSPLSRSISCHITKLIDRPSAY